MIINLKLVSFFVLTSILIALCSCMDDDYLKPPSSPSTLISPVDRVDFQIKESLNDLDEFTISFQALSNNFQVMHCDLTKKEFVEDNSITASFSDIKSQEFGGPQHSCSFDNQLDISIKTEGEHKLEIVINDTTKYNGLINITPTEIIVSWENNDTVNYTSPKKTLRTPKNTVFGSFTFSKGIGPNPKNISTSEYNRNHQIILDSLKLMGYTSPKLEEGYYRWFSIDNTGKMIINPGINLSTALHESSLDQHFDYILLRSENDFFKERLDSIIESFPNNFHLLLIKPGKKASLYSKTSGY